MRRRHLVLPSVLSATTSRSRNAERSHRSEEKLLVC
ncbi:hypothetical protein M3Y99_01759800 [Aphelenchoides fujianensis]|nr:hypothetical protein M3Y99_01759800 [Aphelenchoides fujianensis]